MCSVALNDQGQQPGAQSTSKRIEIRGLTFGYQNRPIFRDFDLTTEARTTVVRGPSGCGKTTLLKLVDGLLQGDPRGCVSRPEPAFLVLQADGLAPWLTGRQNIELFSNALWGKVCQSPLFGQIEAFVDRRVYTLSFGQRRSIELVRALATEHSILLLDEPLNFLDRTRRATFLAHMSDPSVCRSVVFMTSHYDEAGLVDASWNELEFVGEPPYATLFRTGRR